MRKNALSNLAIVVGAGAFGAFCRWLQNQIAFDENGLSTNSPLNILVFVVVLGVAIWFFLIVQGIHERNMTVSDDVRAAFAGTGEREMIVPMIIGVVEVLGGLILILTGLGNSSPALTLVFAVCAMLSGVLTPVLFRSLGSDVSNGTIALLMTIPILLYGIGLINCYKINATNPSVWTYSIQILAYACCAVAFYYVAGFAYGRTSPFKTLYFSMLGAFLSILVVADNLNLGLVLIVVSNATLLLFYCVRMMSNMEEGPEDPERKESEERSSFLTKVQGWFQSRSVDTEEKVEEILQDYHDEEK